MKISRVLITGGNGFLGTHFLQFLAERGVEIHALGTRPPLTGTYHDIAFHEREKLKGLLNEVQPEAIFHLAGVSSSPELARYYEINVVFAANIIEAVKAWGNPSCPIVLTGTSAEYGRIEASDLPLRETTPPRPYDHYGISKYAQTLMGLREARNGWPVIVARPFNIIGPGMPDHLVLQSFVRQLTLIRQEARPPILEVGNLSAVRDFVDVEDVVQAMWLLAQKPEAAGEVFNVCSGRGRSIENCLEILLEMAGMKVEIRVSPERLRAIDIPVHFGSAEKLKQITGHLPGSDIQASLLRIVKSAGLA